MIFRKGIGQRRIFFLSPQSSLKESPLALTGNMALRAIEGGILSKESLEAARRAIRKVVKKTAKLRIRGCCVSSCYAKAF